MLGRSETSLHPLRWDRPPAGLIEVRDRARQFWWTQAWRRPHKPDKFSLIATSADDLIDNHNALLAALLDRTDECIKPLYPDGIVETVLKALRHNSGGVIEEAGA